MDRLSPVSRLLLPALLLTACDGATTTAPPEASNARFQSVPAAPVKDRALDDFCEHHDDAATARTWAWPELDTPAPAAATTWTWVNVWATWCGPCVAEMPMLGRWKDKLHTDGLDVDLQFLSVDANAPDVARYKAAHAEAASSVRIKDYALLAGFLSSTGLDASAVIPLHYFIDPDKKVRCVRMGAVEESDYTTVKRVLKGE